jgi:Flp pilus assembly protein TadD
MKRADELVSKALALDPNDAGAHHMKGNILQTEGRTEEAVAEHERALAIDPSIADTAANLASTICSSANSTKASNMPTRQFE